MKTGNSVRSRLLEEANAIHEEDRAMCHAIGKNGASLLNDHSGVLTHCNAGRISHRRIRDRIECLFYRPG